MKKPKMKILLPVSLGGFVDLYRFQEYMHDQYPESELFNIENFLVLRLFIAEGRIEISRSIDFSINLLLVNNGVGIFVIELGDKIGKSFEDTGKFLFNDYTFIVDGKKTQRSFYSFGIKCFLDIFRLEKLEDLKNISKGSGVRKKVISDSGIDFISIGKEGHYVTFGGTGYVLFKDVPRGMKSKLHAAQLNKEKIFMQGGNVFYVTDEGNEKNLILFLTMAIFYNTYLDVSAGYIENLKKDISGLRGAIKIKGTVGWEWAQKELEIKRLNFLEFLSYYRLWENSYTYLDIPDVIQRLLKLDVFGEKLETNLNTTKFMMTEIERIVEEKQAITFASHTRRLESLLTLLGALGGVAVILVALLGGELTIAMRGVTIAVLVLLPAGIWLFEYIIRRKIKDRSKRAYIGTMIDDLLKRKREWERRLRHFQIGVDSVTEGVGSDVIGFYKKRIQEVENEIDDLKKEMEGKGK